MLEGAFNQEEALSRSLVRDCEIFANLRLTFVSSSTGQLQLALDTRDRLEPVILEQERDLGPAPAPADQAPDNGSTKVLPQTHSNNFKSFLQATLEISSQSSIEMDQSLRPNIVLFHPNQWPSPLKQHVEKKATKTI